MTPAPFLLLHPHDNIAIARRRVDAGEPLPGGGISRERIELGHKAATVPIRAGEAVRKFGQVIGFATSEIETGAWVHVHNVGLGELSLKHEFCSAVPPAPPPITDRTFQGYRRPNGKVGIRNYIAIVTTVNCSATSAKFIADRFDAEILAAFPNVDGVVALNHKGGCAMEFNGSDHRQLARTLAGFAKHPNIGAYLVVGLGCETSQTSFLVENQGLTQLEHLRTPQRGPVVMNIQDMGGVRKTVERGVSVLKEMLPEVNAVRRETIPASELILGLECGGSDGASGVTANPALGRTADLLVACGGTAVLSEIPECYGGEHLLTGRAVAPQVAEKLMERIRWWEDYARKFGGTIDNNPSVGNKKGGLTTIYEKSLGAVAKGGTTALRAVYEYAEPITERGFVLMDTPGYDPASVTGLVAGGCHLVVFTTGRGSCFGCKPAPTIKVSTNTPMYRKMIEDMDLDAGVILDGASVESVGEDLFEMVLRVASGEQTKSEAQGIGDEEFHPWTPGPIF